MSTPVSKEFDHIKERNCLSFDSDFSVHLYSAGGCPTPEERASNKEALQDAVSYTHLTLPTKLEV